MFDENVYSPVAQQLADERAFRAAYSPSAPLDVDFFPSWGEFKFCLFCLLVGWATFSLSWFFGFAALDSFKVALPSVLVGWFSLKFAVRWLFRKFFRTA